jgi:hypothetical protein
MACNYLAPSISTEYVAPQTESNNSAHYVVSLNSTQPSCAFLAQNNSNPSLSAILAMA